MAGAMDAMAAAVPAPSADYEPKREPTFDFSPDGPVPDEELDDYYVSMTCAVEGEEVGTMTFDLWGDQVPGTVRNFLRYCDEGFYDGLSFHRILRNFMVQGGDPMGTGGGSGPHGAIPGEFSDAPERQHGYGVLSMARTPNPDSATSQFFICTDESQAVWQLDGQYASFGKLTSGVETLEALADVPAAAGGGGEASKPTKSVTITKAEVLEGEAPTGETIERPEEPVDLGGQPERVTVQHVLISFNGVPQLGSERSKEEAEALAQEIVEKARAGEDFKALVLEFSDDPVTEGDPNPGVYRLLNNDVRDRASERAMYDLNARYMARAEGMQQQQQAGEMTQEEFEAKMGELVAEAQLEAAPMMWMPRAQMVPGFGDTAFGLEVGAVGLLPYDEQSSPFGWHVIKRIE